MEWHDVLGGRVAAFDHVLLQFKQSHHICQLIAEKVATTLLEVGHKVANSIYSELIELFAIGCGDSTQSFVKVAHQVSQDLQEVVLNDLSFDGQVGEFSCERARDQL